jgi:hypothetical protein
MATVGKSGQYWSGFSPSNIPGLALWYDFSDTSTIDLSGDYQIIRVRDKSGTGRHGTPSNSAGAVWAYDAITKGAFRTPEAASVTMVFDVSLNGSTNFYSAFAATTPVTNESNGILTANAAGGFMFFSCNAAYRFGSTNGQVSTSAGDLHSTIVGSFIGGYEVKRSMNGLMIDLATITTPPVTGQEVPVKFGTYSTQANSGLYHEVILYSNVLSDYDRAAVDEYMIRKWMVPFTTTITGPTDISGCTLWLDTSGGASNFTLSGTNVVKWNDKSGNNYDVSTVGVTNRPIWHDISGYVYFPPNTVMNTGAPLPPTGEETGFLVGTKVTNAAVRGMVGAQAGSTGPSRLIATGSALTYNFRQTNGNPSLNYVFPFDTGWIGSITPSILSWRTKGREAIARIAGQMALYTSDLSAATDTVGRTSIGPAAYNFLELVTYNRTLTDSEMSNVEAHLINKWGLSNVRTFTTLQSNRPFSSSPVFMRPVQFPADIANCLLWLDAKDPTSYVLDSSNNALYWYDKSGWRNDLSASISASQRGPNYSNETFTFTSNRMQVRNMNNQAINGAVDGGRRFLPEFITSNHTLIALHKPASMTDVSRSGNSGLFDFSVPTSATCNVSFPTTLSSTQAGYFNSRMTITAGALAENSSTTEYNIITASIQSNRQTIYRNGVVQADVSGVGILNFVFTVTNTGAPPIVSIGSYPKTTSNFYQGDVRELFAFDRALSPYEVSQAESYLAKKWNLTSLLPSNHIANVSEPPRLTSTVIPTAGLVFPTIWLDAMSYAATHSNNQTITTPWTNRTRRSATQFDPSGSPVFLSNAYAGRPGISLTDGCFFSTANLSNFMLGTLLHYTFIVASLDVSAANYTCAEIRTSPNNNGFPAHRILVYNSSSNRVLSSIIGSNGVTAFTTQTPALSNPPIGQPFIFEANHISSNSLTARINGDAESFITSTSMSAWSTANIASRFVIGTGTQGTFGTPQWPGKVYEIITFPSFIDSEFCYQVRGYLAHKWGVTASLPTYYPYKALRP